MTQLGLDQSVALFLSHEILQISRKGFFTLMGRVLYGGNVMVCVQSLQRVQSAGKYNRPST